MRKMSNLSNLRTKQDERIRLNSKTQVVIVCHKKHKPRNLQAAARNKKNKIKGNRF